MKQPIRAVRSERKIFEKEPKKKRAGDDQCSIDIGYKQKKITCSSTVIKLILRERNNLDQNQTN